VLVSSASWVGMSSPRGFCPRAPFLDRSEISIILVENACR
jgi:hypothetical protein